MQGAWSLGHGACGKGRRAESRERSGKRETLGDWEKSRRVKESKSRRVEKSKSQRGEGAKERNGEK